MRILVTNDDGIYAPGIKALVGALSNDHELFVIAPDQERSGVGHAFTIGSPVTCLPDDKVFSSEKITSVWKCSGTPVDCVKMGLLVFLKDNKPDLVLSGINRGANLSFDHLYSGTVGAAIEGTLGSIPSISMSVCSDDGQIFHFDSAAKVISVLLSEPEFTKLLSSKYSLNVNVPGIPVEHIKGCRFTTVGESYYEDGYHQTTGDDGNIQYLLHGKPFILDEREHADNVAVRDGFVSITPFAPDLTCYNTLTKLQDCIFPFSLS